MGILLVILLFLILVTVHEFGHYLAARLCGVRVLSFSVGMGPEVFGFTDRVGTRWRFSLLPLGGYVSMLGGVGHPDELKALDSEHRSEAFPAKPLYQRALIVFAGPLANLLLGLVVSAFVLSLTTQSQPSNQVGAVPQESAAWQAGLRPGNRLVSVEGRETDTWGQVSEALSLRAGASAQLQVVNAGGDTRILSLDLSLGTSARALRDEGIGVWGLYPAFLVSETLPGLPAEGLLEAGDILVAVNGQPVTALDTLGDQIPVEQTQGFEPLALELLREGNLLSLSLTPAWDAERSRPLAGILFGADWVQVSYSPLAAVREGLRQAWQLARALPQQVARILGGSLPSDALSGPVGIVDSSSELVQQSWWIFWLMLALLSFNLAIVNLLPLPVLDGGHLFFYALEAVRGRPLSQRVQEWVNRLGLVLLFSLFVFLTFQDIVGLQA